MSQLLQNAVYGGGMILAVAVLRRGLKDKLIPEARLALWAVCLFRLLTPVAPGSGLSLWGLFASLAPVKPSSPGYHTMSYPPPGEGAFVPQIVEPGTSPDLYFKPAPFPWEKVLLAVWLIVGAVLAVRFVLSYARTRRAVGRAILIGRDDPRYGLLPKCARLREGVMDGAPLTFGVARPVVVLTPGLAGEKLACVLAHEGVHARRRDNLWHYGMALALVVQWWNPAVWLMARLLRRDVELSCDRAAVKKLGEDRRAEYANALVSMATAAEGPAFCQAFGRKAVEERIISVMKYKKMTVIGAALTLALVLAVTVGFASNPGEQKNDTVEYHGRIYNRSELSQETLDWLDWYLSLPEEGQMSVSMVPPELIPNGDVTSYDAAGPDDGLAEALAKYLDGTPSNKPKYVVYPSTPADEVRARYKELLARLVSEGSRTKAEADKMLAVLEDTIAQVDKGEADSLMFNMAAGEIAASVTFACPAEPLGCTVENCAVSGGHHHEGDTVVLHYDTLPADLSQCPVCPVGGCTARGYHTHGGTAVYRCNGAHCGGVCDGSCVVYFGANSSPAEVPIGETGLDYDTRVQDSAGVGDEPIAYPPEAIDKSASYGACGVEGCTVSGSHTIHCNGFHSGGVCDGSCAAYSLTSPSMNSGHHSENHSSGHHGNHH